MHLQKSDTFKGAYFYGISKGNSTEFELCDKLLNTYGKGNCSDNGVVKFTIIYFGFSDHSFSFLQFI